MRKSIVWLAAFAASPVLGQDPGARMDSILKAAEAKGFSGIARVTRNGNVLLEKGYGLANRAAKIPFTPSTVVQIGSNTKDFTAVAILQLQQRGLLSLDDRLSRFFPSAPPDKRDITVRQLLHHRAGFPLGLGGDFEPVSRQQLIDNAMSFKLLFAPGSRESYSNTGYALLAAIIENVTHKTYDQYLSDNILKPLGLTHTGFLLPHFSDRVLAHGYRSNGEDAGTMLSHPHAEDGPYWNLRGNGGMLSTVDDMAAFYKALFESEKLLPLNARDGLFDPKEPMGLAGSDLVNFFLYERVPAAGLEVILASTNAAMKAPVVREQIASILDLPRMGGPNGEGEPVSRATGKPVDAATSALIDEFVSTFNKGDRAALLAFINANYLLSADGPTAEQRVARLSSLHDDLGTLTVVTKAALENGTVQVGVTTEKASQALLIFDIDPSPPHKIRRFGIQVGG